MARSTATTNKPVVTSSSKPKRKTSSTKSGKSSGGSKSTTPNIRTYAKALDWLESLVNHEKSLKVHYNSTNFSLARMNRLLAALDNPHKKFKSVHIAGTKGKGSTAAMLHSMLSNCDLKIGLYTSPHVLTVRERVAINGERIGESQFTRMINAIAKASEEAGGGVTYFEAISAAAFYYFAKSKVDLAVIETGLGGRLDSTNVIKPEVCAITSISIDHTDQLGETLDSIAREKAGIIKPGVPVISAPQKKDARSVLEEIAAKHGTPLQFAGEDVEFSYRFEASRALGPHTRLCLTTRDSKFEHVHVPLLGEHQAINCSIALTMVDILKQRGFNLDDQRIVEGLAGVHLEGRMEMVNEEPRILVDGAHNAASVNALMRAIGQNIPYDSMVVVFGCQRGKDVHGMLRHIQLGADKVIFTSTGSGRSMDPHDLAAMFSEQCGKMAQVEEDLHEALKTAERAISREDLICITGSFYLVGRAKRLMARLALEKALAEDDDDII